MIPFSYAITLFLSITLLRILVGFQPHSGQDNHHGSLVAYGGDFEAQRHWMELTYSLPIKDWYWYDLHYWGLDYPPLTAYVSWLCGYASYVLVGPHSVALDTSRGIEDPTHKAFMRGTVIVTDLLFYVTACWYWSKALLTPHDHKSKNANKQRLGTSDIVRMVSFLIATLQPAIVLIDHGHFQYNTTALGLALWSFYFMTNQSGGWANTSIIGSIFFCCALSFKQMTLYYAPVVFAYLLGRCLAPTNTLTTNNHSRSTFLVRFVSLAVTVLITFAVLWGPVILHGPDDTTYLDRLLHVLHRILPFQRGLFEGKVSNVWCALSVHPIKIRQRIPQSMQPLCALGLTLLLILPACIKLFQVGREAPSPNTQRRHQTLLLWGAMSSALAFFLASFQVHEKSILMALAPAVLLVSYDFRLVVWFSLVSAWTLWPLLVVDRLQVAYVCVQLIFSLLLVVFQDHFPEAAKRMRPESNQGFFGCHFLLAIIPVLSYLAMLGLHVGEIFVSVPSHLPDLFPVLWSIAGCGFFALAWLASCWHLYSPREPVGLSTKQKTS